MLAQDVQHVVFVAQQDRHPCRGGAFGQPHGALETAARKVEDVPLLALFSSTVSASANEVTWEMCDT